MSYGLKYTLTFRDSTVISNKLWRLNIYSNGWSGSSTSVTGTDNPIQISYKKNNLITAICGSEGTVNLMATTAGQFNEFLTAEPLQYYIDVQYSTNGGSTWATYWSGVNTTDTTTQAQSNVPYTVQLKFNCGLGELQWHRYENSGVLFGELEQVIQVINNCMTNLPYTKNFREIISVREDTMNDADGLLEQLYVNDTAFYEIGDDGLTHGFNCNKLLNTILTAINCRIYQSNNMWFVERIYDRVKASPTYFDYTGSSSVSIANSFSHSATGTLSWMRTINNSTYPKLVKGSEKAVTQKQPVLSYKFNPTILDDLQLIPNPYFNNIPTSVSYVGSNPVPLRWDRSAGNSFTMSAGGTVLTFASSSIASSFGFYTSPQFYVNNTMYVRKILNVSGATITISSNFDSTSTSGVTSSVQLIGGDILETVDPFATNINDQSGYSWGSNIISNNAAWVAANIPNVYGGGAVTWGHNPYYIHASRQPGSTVTVPYMILDPDYSIIATNIRQYFRFKFTPNYGRQPTYSECWNDAGIIVGGAVNWVTVFSMKLTNLNTGTYYYHAGQSQINGSDNASWYLGGSGGLGFSIQGLFSAVNVSYPHQMGYRGNLGQPISGFLTQNQVATMIANSWNSVSRRCYPFYIAFDCTSQYTIGFNSAPGTPFPDTPAPYSFDLLAFPPVFDILNISGFGTDVSVDDYALGTVDMQYKDNQQSATGSMAFYSGPDTDLRWNELQVNVSLGDTTSKGFPSSFFIYTGINTGTWHNLGASDTGQLLVDIFFKNFAQIIANYRNNLRGNVIFDNTLQYFHSVEDEDGTLYIQLGHTFDIKKNSYQTDMEGMADLGVVITPIHTLPTKPYVTPIVAPAVPAVVHPMVSIGKTTPVKPISVVTTTANPAFPL